MNEQPVITQEPASQNLSRTSLPAIRRFNMKSYFGKQFSHDVESFQKSGRLKSGFANIDAITNLYPGLYVIEAISSLGKTTLIHQMSDQIAESGNHVLFFSLEQSAFELASKSIARTIAKDNPENGLSSLQVRRGRLSDPRIASATEKYSAYSDRITVIECSFQATIDDITKIVTGYIDHYKVKPVVVIDYLQVIQAAPENRMTTKDTVDYHVRRLKELQTDRQFTMIVISSLNRQNYMNAIDFESFKESGGIEYTADVLWGFNSSAYMKAYSPRPIKLTRKDSGLRKPNGKYPEKLNLSA